MRSFVHARLSMMMFLEFFIWGGWFVTMGSYLALNLGATGAQTASAYSTQSWGAIVAPFFVGLIADRYVNAERLLGGIHLIGTVLMDLLYRAERFDDFYPYLLAYMLLYMSTLPLVNSVAFRSLDDPSKSFSTIRLWGTVGWIVAGLIISYLFAWDSREALAEGMLRNTFLMCSAASASLGLFSFTLPRTPPLAAAKDSAQLDGDSGQANRRHGSVAPATAGPVSPWKAAPRDQHGRALAVHSRATRAGQCGQCHGEPSARDRAPNPQPRPPGVGLAESRSSHSHAQGTESPDPIPDAGGSGPPARGIAGASAPCGAVCAGDGVSDVGDPAPRVAAR
jgi:cytochrome c553